MIRPMFYKDRKGNLHRYHYCMDCGKQYKEPDLIHGLIVNVGSSKLPIEYCKLNCLDKKITIHTFKGMRHIEESLEVKIAKSINKKTKIKKIDEDKSQTTEGDPNGVVHVHS